MKLTESKLRDLITQVYLDAFNDLVEEEPILLAEPQAPNEDPPSELEANAIVSEGNQPMTKLINILNTLSPDERKRLFGRFGYYTGEHLLSQLNSIKKAEKGAL